MGEATPVLARPMAYPNRHNVCLKLYLALNLSCWFDPVRDTLRPRDLNAIHVWYGTIAPRVILKVRLTSVNSVP